MCSLKHPMLGRALLDTAGDAVEVEPLKNPLYNASVLAP